MFVFSLRHQLQGYTQDAFQHDLLAGVIVSIVLLPQAMAYSDLAGLPPASGLLAAMLPMLVYALLGSSRSLSVGPVAIASLMTHEALLKLPEGTSPTLAAACLAGLIGIILLILAVINVGKITHFISHSVISGFSSGAAVIIMISQSKSLLGLEYNPTATALSTAILYHLPTTILGITGILTLFIFRSKWLLHRINRLPISQSVQSFLLKLGAPCTITILTIMAVSPLNDGNIALVGQVDFQFQSQTQPWQSIPDIIATLFPSAVLLALIGYMESVAVGRTIANQRKERLDPNQELWAIGFANISSAISMGMPVAGGFGRSMVNEQSGAKTQVASIVTATIILLLCLIATASFAYIPKPALAAIVVFAVIPLIDYHHIKRLWRDKSPDLVVWWVTFISAITLDLGSGLALGIMISIAVFIIRSGSPHCVVVGRLPGTEQFRNVQRFQVETLDEALFIRIDESLFFANIQIIEDYMNLAISKQNGIKVLVLIGSGINNIDSDGLDFLQRLERNLKVAGITLTFAEFKHYLLDKLILDPWVKHVRYNNLFISTQQAFVHYQNQGQRVNISYPDTQSLGSGAQPE
jgi:SulP family sulfate permease